MLSRVSSDSAIIRNTPSAQGEQSRELVPAQGGRSLLTHIQPLALNILNMNVGRRLHTLFGSLFNRLPGLSTMLWDMVQPKEPPKAKLTERVMCSAKPAKIINQAFRELDTNNIEDKQECLNALKRFNDQLLLKESSSWVHIARNKENLSPETYANEDDARLLEHGIEFAVIEMKYGLPPTPLTQQAKTILTEQTLSVLLRNCYITITDSKLSAVEQAHQVIKGFIDPSNTNAQKYAEEAVKTLDQMIAHLEKLRSNAINKQDPRINKNLMTLKQLKQVATYFGQSQLKPRKSSAMSFAENVTVLHEDRYEQAMELWQTSYTLGDENKKQASTPEAPLESERVTVFYEDTEQADSIENISPASVFYFPDPATIGLPKDSSQPCSQTDSPIAAKESVMEIAP